MSELTPSTQTKVRATSDRVKLLEDVLVAFAGAHRDLLKILSAPRVRDSLRTVAVGGSDPERAAALIDDLFRTIDRAEERYNRMMDRMREINEAAKRDGEAD